MRVFLADGEGFPRLVGRADVPADHGPVLEVPLSGPASDGKERFLVGTLTHLPDAGAADAAPVAERVVLLAPVQDPELLPGWAPLAA